MENLTIPVGYKYKFEPTESDLLVYLSRKANGMPLPCKKAIREINLYRLPDPEKLFQGTEEKVAYVFTKLKKVSENGKRVDRSVWGNRTWKGVDGGHPIYDERGFHIGEKKNFVFINKMKVKLGYNMKEFSLDKEALRNSRFKDYVICQVNKKSRKIRCREFPEEDKCNNSSVRPVGSRFFKPYVEELEINEEGFGQNHGEESNRIGGALELINNLASAPNSSASLDDFL